jgi:hypothetical protein
MSAAYDMSPAHPPAHGDALVGHHAPQARRAPPEQEHDAEGGDGEEEHERLVPDRLGLGRPGRSYA